MLTKWILSKTELREVTGDETPAEEAKALAEALAKGVVEGVIDGAVIVGLITSAVGWTNLIKEMFKS